MKLNLVALISMLALVLGFASPSDAVPEPAQLFGAEIQGQCPAGCSTPISILSVKNIGRGTGDGFRIEVKWTVGNPPPGFQLASNVAVGVEVTLPDGKVRKGSASSSVLDHVTVVTTDGRPGDAAPKSFKVTVAANGGRNISIVPLNVTSTEVIRRRLGGGHDVRVRWDESKLVSCSLCRKVSVRAVVTLLDNRVRDGSTEVPISDSHADLIARGLISDSEVKSITATAKPIDCDALFCVVAKNGTF